MEQEKNGETDKADSDHGSNGSLQSEKKHTMLCTIMRSYWCTIGGIGIFIALLLSLYLFAAIFYVISDAEDFTFRELIKAAANFLTLGDEVNKLTKEVDQLAKELKELRGKIASLEALETRHEVELNVLKMRSRESSSSSNTLNLEAKSLPKIRLPAHVAFLKIKEAEKLAAKNGCSKKIAENVCALNYNQSYVEERFKQYAMSIGHPELSKTFIDNYHIILNAHYTKKYVFLNIINPNNGKNIWCHLAGRFLWSPKSISAPLNAGPPRVLNVSPQILRYLNFSLDQGVVQVYIELINRAEIENKIAQKYFQNCASL